MDLAADVSNHTGTFKKLGKSDSKAARADRGNSVNQSPGEGKATTRSKGCKEGQRTGIQEAGAWGMRGGRRTNAVGAQPSLVLSQQQREAFRSCESRAGQVFLESIFVTTAGEHLGPDRMSLEQLSGNKSRTAA